MLTIIFYIILIFAFAACVVLIIEKDAERNSILNYINECMRLPNYSFVDKKHIGEFNSLMKFIEDEIRENKKINTLEDPLFQKYIELRAIINIFKTCKDITIYHNTLNIYLQKSLINPQILCKLYKELTK